MGYERTDVSVRGWCVRECTRACVSVRACVRSIHGGAATDTPGVTGAGTATIGVGTTVPLDDPLGLTL